MKEVKVRVYSLDELSEEARERAHEDWASNCDYPWYKEARDTIKAFEKEFGVSLGNWSYDSWNFHYSLGTGSIDDNVLALKGNRARAWFWNNHGHLLMEPECHFWTHDKDGKLFRAVAPDSRKFTSKVFYSRVYDGTCPFTGYYLDCDALDPMAYFCFGVEWDDKLQKRVQTKDRSISADNCNTVESILDDCAYSLFSALRDDVRHCGSMDYFKEMCEANDWVFTEDGEMWNGKYEVKGDGIKEVA